MNQPRYDRDRFVLRRDRGRPAKDKGPIVIILVAVIVLAMLGTVTLGVILLLAPTRTPDNKNTQPKPPEPKPPVPPVIPPTIVPPKPVGNLYLTIQEALRERRTTRSAQAGGGLRAFEDVPAEGALLTGLEVGIGKWFTQDVIHSIRPIYQTSRGRILGTQHGGPLPRVETLEAKPGYAVGGLALRAGGGIDAVAVTFMAIDGQRLDPSRSYQSNQVGGTGGNPISLTGDGKPVVGIFGKLHPEESALNGLGIVTISATP
jgi:hypothetical protein